MEELIERTEAGIWRCKICSFTAMSKKVIENHIKNTHPEVLNNEEKRKSNKNEKRKDKKKEKREKKPYANFEFEPLINKEIIVTLKNGSIVKGKLKYETAYNLALTNATITGTKHVAKVEYLIINKSNVALVHTPPTELTSIESE